ncbi:MAG: hypothetical protein F4Y86_15930 [Gammaproteobacteria bacterium]|nr:hypothetical protein [Gammaproteobacteria bacterium]MYB37947.1 hypothetical protein [Gammaproteobacteria bacterium]
MTDNEHPNWIKARVACNAETWIERLYGVMKIDVQRATKETGREHRIDLRNGREITVSSLVEDSTDQWQARLGLTIAAPNTLRAASSVGTDTIVNIHWTGHECELSICEKKMEPWEISRRLLEPLFFGDD